MHIECLIGVIARLFVIIGPVGNIGNVWSKYYLEVHPILFLCSYGQGYHGHGSGGKMLEWLLFEELRFDEL